MREGSVRNCRVTGIHVNMLKRKKPHRKRTKADSSDPVAYKQRSIIGSKVQHGWREKTGVVTQWKGTVLDQLPVNPSLFLVKYDEFDCVYGIELFKDERVSGLEILPDKSENKQVLPTEPGEVIESLVGKQVEYVTEDSTKRTGLVIHQVQAKPSVYFIKFDDDFHIYVYDLVKTS
ncbi:hypothetical protein scyTo_0000090 [Scyliorhinus torazame]|uniref:Spindlin n=1 Tax=Scyliorhinus torazame TaxID=75743 RepID=A0A401NQ59_SCYTO|nr:hypothetical protein [Scyliorhinus torazame]